MFDGTNFHAVAKAIERELIAGRIIAGAATLTFEGATRHQVRIPASLWRGWHSQDDTRFWVTGDLARLMADRFGKVDINRRIEAFGVRFEPRGIEALLSVRPPARPDSRPQGRSGGRRPRTTGEPIARVVLRLLALPASELAAYKVDALAAELIDEYRALGINPPHFENASRDAAGILRALRERGAT